MPQSLTVPLFAVRHKEIGGTEFAIYNLVKGLAQTSLKTAVVYDTCEHLSPEFVLWLEQNPTVPQATAYQLPGPKNIRFLQESLFEWSRQSDGWVLYPNYFIPPRRPFSHRPTTVILHDIQYKVLPEHHSSRRKAWLDFYLPRMFERADSVVLISQSEKRYVEEFFGSKSAEKCDVVYNAIDWERFRSPAAAEPASGITDLLSRPFLLTVCHQFPHKNLQTLLLAFDQIAHRHPDLFLYMVGVDSPSNRVFVETQLSSATRRRVKLLGFLSDQDLGTLYRAAQLFLLPSLYEGFGMPAVEALGLGTPILVSGTTSLPEVTMGLGNYVDEPKNVDEWATRIEDLIATGCRPGVQTVAAVLHAYSPKVIAENLLSVLRSRE